MPYPVSCVRQSLFIWYVFVTVFPTFKLGEQMKGFLHTSTRVSITFRAKMLEVNLFDPPLFLSSRSALAHHFVKLHGLLSLPHLG